MVGTAAGAQPDVVLIIHEDAMLVLIVRPLVSLSGAAPAAEIFPGGIELDHRWRRFRAIFLVLDAAGPVEYPDVIMPIDCDSRDHAKPQIIRKLWPRWIGP